MIDGLFYPMLVNTIVVSVVMLFMSLFSRLIKKRYIPKWRYVVGIMLAVRLLVPFQLTLPRQIAPAAPLAQTEKTEFAQFSEPQGQEILARAPMEFPTMEKKWRLAEILHLSELLWIAGIFGFLLISGVRYSLAKHWLRRWRMPADMELDIVARKLTAELGIRRKIKVYLSEEVDSPMLVGIFQPSVYLPKGVLLREEIRLVLRHELIHYKRRDLWCKLFMLLANAVHWFNPLIYILRRSMDNDIEMICDGEVVRELEEEQRQVYARAMLAVMKQAVNPSLRVGARFLGGPRSMQERFADILQLKTRKRGTMMGTLIALLLLCGSIGYTEPEAASIGIIGGADGPTAIYTNQEIEWDNTGLQALYTAIMTENAGKYLEGEYKTAGVYVLKEEHTDAEDIYYCLTQYGEFGFENGYFTKVSGTGTIPVKMRFDKSRKLLEYKVPQDGSGYVDSIRQTFPLDIQADALTPGDDLRTKLDTQEIEQAKTYLHAIGREAEVVYNWRLEKGARLAEMDVEVSNLLLDKFSAYPYWIGSLEKIENGVRYVYTKSWTEEDKGNGIVSFTKYIYDTQEVVAKQAYIVRGNVLTALTGSEEIK